MSFPRRWNIWWQPESTSDSGVADLLISGDFLNQLEKLRLVSRHILAGRAQGERRGMRRGVSVEFADHRQYYPGDDFRYIDWNILGRLDRLFVKMFVEEEDLTVHLLIDSSKSMSFGDASKFEYALKTAAAVGYIGLVNLDRVGVTAFSSEGSTTLAPHRGRAHIHLLFGFLERLKPSGATTITSALREIAHSTTTPGLAILFSDLLDPRGYKDGLLALRFRGFEVVVIHILSDEELSPPLAGEFRFFDSETGENLDVTVDRYMLKAYSSNLAQMLEEAEQFCLAHEIDYVRCASRVPFEELVLQYLKHGGVIR